MSPESQNLAIAKYCGADVEHLRIPAPDDHLREYHYFFKKYASDHVLKHGEPCINLQWIPDYINDLNSMHEAEKCLSETDLRHYKTLLGNDITADGETRAKAFLETVEKWEMEQVRRNDQGHSARKENDNER